jgi:BA14K-like protein
MFSEIISAHAPSTKCRASGVGGRVRLALQVSVLAGACAAIAAPAFAAGRYDGNWSVVITTTGGACDPTLRYPLAITDGMVVNGGDSPVTVQGRVTPRGAVTVSVQSGNQWANGAGRLCEAVGSGTWNGQGSAGACVGTWVAQRRSGVETSEAVEPGRPIYNYAPQQIAPGAANAAIAACQARYHSYDRASGTYLGVDGMRHPCR